MFRFLNNWQIVPRPPLNWLGGEYNAVVVVLYLSVSAIFTIVGYVLTAKCHINASDGRSPNAMAPSLNLGDDLLPA